MRLFLQIHVPKELYINRRNYMDSVNTFLKHSVYYNDGLYGSPLPIDGTTEPWCIVYNEYNGLLPFYSIVMPIYNQQNVILKNLDALVRCTGGTYELILILDCCSDMTEVIVRAWIDSLQVPSNLYRIVVIVSKTPLFETSCDNIGFRLARGMFFLEIQADMEMTEQNYNLVLTKPFIRYPNVIGVSGRCSHDLKETMGVGRLGHLISQDFDASAYSNSKFYVNETCNRGPLLLDAHKVRSLGYLDEHNFYLDNSDHDLFARAFAKFGLICGYVPINFKSPLEDGSTRKPRDELNTQFLKLRKARSNGGFLQEYKQKNLQSRPTYVLSLSI